MKNSKLRVLISAVMVCFCSMSYLPLAATADTGTAGVDELIKRLDKLEQENAALRAELTEVKNQVVAIKQAPPPATAAGAVPADMNLVVNKPPVTVKLYGYVKGDAIHNDSQLGEVAYNAPNEGTANGQNENEFHFTARETRFGVDLAGPGFWETGKVVGKIEGDFYGSTNPADDDTNTSPNFRLRQAYGDLIYGEWDLLVGQTWDYFSPLNPSTLNLALLWKGGNIGARHAQARLSKKFPNLLGGDWLVQAGGIESSSLSADSGWPNAAGYVSYDTKVWGRPLTLGLGGLYGTQDASSTITRQAPIYAGTVVMKYVINDMFTVSGEGYYGSNLSQYQGSTTSLIVYSDNTYNSMRERGGWVQLTVLPMDKVTLNGGIGIGDVVSDSRGSTAIWEYNYSQFYNIRYALAKSVVLGFEYQHFNTKYDYSAGGDANRFMSSLIYTF